MWFWKMESNVDHTHFHEERDMAFTSDFCDNHSHPASPASLRPRVLYLMSSSPSSRVPKSQVPTHASRCPRPLVPVPLLYTAYMGNLSLHNARWKWAAVKLKVNGNTYDISSIKRVTKKSLEVARCSRAKQRQRNVQNKVCCRCKVAFAN